MIIKAFQVNKDGKIELNPSELEKLMQEAYKEGREYERATMNNSYIYWNYPYRVNTLSNSQLEGSCVANIDIDKLTSVNSNIKDYLSTTNTTENIIKC